MAVDTKNLVGPMLNAIEPIVGKEWGVVEDYAKTEGDKMAQTLAKIGELYTAKKINDLQAKALLDMQKQSMQAVLLTIEGIGLITAQNAINAALGAVQGVVNKAIGFSLL